VRFDLSQAYKSNRAVLHSFNKRLYKDRNVIERCFCRLKDLRRIATRYDKLMLRGRHFLSSRNITSSRDIVRIVDQPRDSRVLKTCPSVSIDGMAALWLFEA
jgi:hypothetical protein